MTIDDEPGAEVAPAAEPKAAAAEKAPAEAENDDGESTEVPADDADSIAAETEIDVDYDIPINFVEPDFQYFLKQCDMEGNVTLEVDITEFTEDLDYFYCQSMAQDASGTIYMASDSTVLMVGADGSNKGRIDLQSGEEFYIQSMVSAGDGTVLASGWHYDEASNSGGQQVVRLENGGMTEVPIEASKSFNGNYQLFPGSTENTVLFSDGSILYSLDYTTGATTKLLSWLDCDINGNNLSGVVSQGEDTILVPLQSYSQSAESFVFELGTLRQVPVDQIPARTILSMGAVYLDSNVQNAIIRFNRQNDTYRITLVDYSAYNTEEDYSLGETQLDRDIVSGSCPDILFLDSASSIDRYISKGALADLSALMDQDSSISMDDLVEAPLRGYIRDGKLYAMPMSFYIQMCYASAKLVGDRTSWTMEDMAQIIQGLDDDVQVSQWYTQTDFVDAMIAWTGQFIDYGNATCSFDSEAFQSLLAVAKKLPAEIDWDDYRFYGDELQMLQSGDCLLAISYGMSGSYDIKNYFNLYIPENGIVPIGFPTGSGNGALLTMNSTIAISSRCQNQQGAWEFLRTMLSDDIQSEQWSFPVTKAAFDKVLESATERSFYLDENGEKVYYDDSGYIGETEYPMEPLTEAQLDAFRAFVDGAQAEAINYDQDLLEIVNDEIAAYFAGDKSAEDVSKLIQSRVTIYLGEIS